MACLVGYGTYRVEYVDHAVPVRIVGPDGRQHRQLSRGCSKLIAKGDVERGKADIARIVWALNVAETNMAQSAERFVASVASSRDVVDRLLVALKVETVTKNGSVWVKAGPSKWNRVAGALLAVGRVTAVLANVVFGGRDPSKVDPAQSRIGGAAIAYSTARDGNYNSDTDRRLRMGKDPTAAPRYDDPRFFELLVAALRKTGAAEVFVRLCGLARHAGPRAFQCLSLNMYDILSPKLKPGRISAPNKGSKLQRVLSLIPLGSEFGKLIAWIAGERARISGKTIEELRVLAQDPTQRAELEAMPLFTEDGTSFIKYDRLYKVFRRAAEAGELYLEGDEFEDEGDRRHVTFHLLRHEYVHARLDAADLMSAEARAAEREKIIKYMRWKDGKRMLAWYSAHHLVKTSSDAAIRFNELVDAKTGEAGREAGRDRAGDDATLELVDEFA